MDTRMRAGVHDKTRTHAGMQSVCACFALCFHTDIFRQLTLVQLTHMLYYRKRTIVLSFSFVVAPPRAWCSAGDDVPCC